MERLLQRAGELVVSNGMTPACGQPEDPLATQRFLVLWLGGAGIARTDKESLYLRLEAICAYPRSLRGLTHD